MSTNTNETTQLDREKTHTMAVGDTPYWCQNIPRDQWPSKCPEFLQNVSERDKMIIGTPDSEFRRLSWAEVVDVVGVYETPPSPDGCCTVSENITDTKCPGRAI